MARLAIAANAPDVEGCNLQPHAPYLKRLGLLRRLSDLACSFAADTLAHFEASKVFGRLYPLVPST
jgi:hypothetical protein